jgi:predicted AlkP superfamily phosphohydrolase/phosphomutase
MIGLDGADGRLLDRHSTDGSLPHLAALRAHGRAHRLSAPPGITDDAVWASFQYGVEVGEHGRYHYRLPLGEGRIGMAHRAEEDRLAFWDDLSSQGMRVAVLDVPKCRNPRPLNGIHLADWLVHGRYFELPRSQPPSLATDILERFGPAPPSRCAYRQPVLEDDDVRDIMGNLRAGVAKKRSAGLHYIASEPWDLFVLAFKEAHCCDHAFWDFDAGHPAFDPARRARLGDPRMTILRDVDGAVGDLVAAAGPSAEVVVFSTTDFEPNGCFNHLMPEIVDRLNALLSACPATPIAPAQSDSRAAPPPSGWQCAILPYNENCTALRVARRSPAAFADAGPAVPPDPRTLQAIEMQLSSLQDADTGERVVSKITRPSSELEGSRAATLPDLLIHCASGRFPRAVESPRLGRIEGRIPAMRPGNHRAGGFLVAAGALAASAVADVRTMAGLGPLARTVLGRAIPQSVLLRSDGATQ